MYGLDCQEPPYKIKGSVGLGLRGLIKQPESGDGVNFHYNNKEYLVGL